MNREDEIIGVMNDHKAHLLALQALITAVMRALPVDLQATALEEWDKEREAAKTVLLNSSAPEQLLVAFDHYVQMVNNLRIYAPKE